MSDPQLIPVVCKSKTGQLVTFHVREVISIDGRPLQPDQSDVLNHILQRLNELEEATHG